MKFLFINPVFLILVVIPALWICSVLIRSISAFHSLRKGQSTGISTGKVSTRTFISIGLLISFFLPWISFHVFSYVQIFSVSGYNIPITLTNVYSDSVDTIDAIILKLLYIAYLIPIFAAYNIFKDFTQSEKLTCLNEFIAGIIISMYIIIFGVGLKENGAVLQIGAYTTIIFSVLGLFSRFFKSYTLPNAKSKETGLVQKGMKYQAEGNYSEAFVCFYEAAKQNDTIAYNKLGELYEKGLGVEKNITMARKWYEKAAALGDEEAKMRLEILKQGMI
jgi:hypothetical protein